MASYSPVYSAAFIQYSESTPNFEFEVPASFTAVVREIDVTTELGGSQWGLVINDSELAPGVQIWYGQTLGALQWTSWRGRVVVPGGGHMVLQQYTLGVGGCGYVGGYLLRNTAT